MLRAVIFDFDGVITDSEILHLRSFNQVLAQYNIEIATQDYYKDYLGLTDFALLEQMVERGLLKVGEGEVKNIAEQKKQVFEKLAKTEGRIIEGVRSCLEMLERTDVLMAICSGALLAEIELILDEARLRHFFDVVVSAEQVKKSKPHPEGFLLALRKLNEKTTSPISASQCVAIEDSHWGLEAAKAAGMHTLAVTNSYDADQLKPAEKIVSRLDELTIGDLQRLCV